MGLRKGRIWSAFRATFGRGSDKRRLGAGLLALLMTLPLAAGVVAQVEPLPVMITVVESQSFPQVTAPVAVLGEGGPVFGLTAVDFQVLEDGRTVPSDSITVTSDRLENLQLVLAVDVSMSPEDLASLRTAANALLSTLEPKDKLAVVAFADEASLVYAFTNNTEQLQVSIGDLTPEGNFTALHQALDQTLTLFDSRPAGRNAVIAITDRRDNVGLISEEEIISRAQAAHIPLYIIGLGDKVALDPLQDMVGATGGRYISLAGVDQVEPTLAEIAEELRQGYQVTFVSGLKADNAKHNLTIVATHQGRQGRAESQFEAIPGQVEVTLPNLSEGQTVGGVVNLTAEVKAPGPVTSLEYQVDGRPLAQAVDPPYGFEWDTTTVAPGFHRLTANVVDQAGNEGQTGVNLNIVPPLVVTLPISQTRVEVGEPFTVMAEIEALEAISQVGLLVDGQQVAAADTPPYPLSFDSLGYPAGSHLVTVRVEDSLGRTAESSVMMQFVPPPAPEPPFWQRWFDRLRQNEWVRLAVVVAAWSLVILLVLAVTILGLLRIAAIQRRRRRKLYNLEIANQGNIATPYELSADDPLGLLKFQFGLYGAKLPVRQVTQVSPTRGAPVETAVETQPAASRPARQPDNASSGGARQTLDTARQTSASSMQTAGALSSIFSMIGSLLPGSAGASARRASSNIRRGQSTVRQVTYAPQQVTRTADQIKSQARRATPTSAKTGRPVESRTVDTGTTPAGTDRRSSTAPNGFEKPAPIWAQTPPVEPGGTLTVDLVIDPVKLRQTRPYSFKILSRPVEGDDLPVTVETANIQLPRGSCLLRLLPYIAFLTAMFLVVVTGLFLWLNVDKIINYLTGWV